MNQGLISSRYAKALLAFADSCGEGERVIDEAHRIEAAIRDIPQVHRIVTDPAAVSREEKMALFRSVLAPDGISSSMENFLSLVLRNRREYDLRFILHTFTILYYRDRGVKFATVTTAVDPPENMVDRIRRAIEDRFHCRVVMEDKVDPSIIGGVTVRVDDYLLDASVAGQLDTVRKEFTRKNKRIV